MAKEFEEIKIHIGDADYRWKSPVHSAALKGRRPGQDLPLTLITVDEMESRRAKNQYMRACPASIAFDASQSKLMLFPIPNGEFVLIVRVKPEEKQEPPVLPQEQQRQRILGLPIGKRVPPASGA